jgi:isopenicillin-N N-acyltransferase-like protein
MALPVVELAGDSAQRGRAHGEALRDRIRDNVAIYYERLGREAALGKDEARDRARLYLRRIEGKNPGYADEMRGVAEGAGLDPVDVAMLNVRYELLYYQFGVGGANNSARPVPEPDGCTAFAVLPGQTDSGHLWIGQNWDWIPEARGAVLRKTEPDGTRTLAFTEAGIVGAKIGLSSRGIGLCLNGMTTTEDDWSSLRTPVHVRCDEILRARSFEDAVAVVTGEPRACTTNFLIAATPNQVADLETAPTVCNRLTPGPSETLVHTNNFLDPDSLGITEAPNPRRRFSVGRCDRMAELLAAAPRPLTVPMIQQMLKDHLRWPYGICRHRAPDEPPERHYTTVTSVIMDLEDKQMWITDGPPCESEWAMLRL